MLQSAPTTHFPSPFPAPEQIAVNGVTLEVFQTPQSGTHTPIVLCHGWPEHAYAWRHQIPALAAAGYHVIVPNQRGYGNSDCPKDVTAYDIAALTGDLAALLDQFGYADAVFVGHDWGANVVWSMAQLHPQRVRKLIALALPYQPRTPMPWIEFMEQIFGPENYFVHFNRQPGVADTVLDENTEAFLRNLFRKDLPATPPTPGMMMMNLATAPAPLGQPVMSEADLAVLANAFHQTGFTSSINWYRNLDRNWHLLADVDPVIHQPALMIYGTQDLIPPAENLQELVPNVTEVSLNCGHWIQQELPADTTTAMLDWLGE